MTRLIDANALEEELVSHEYKHSPYLHFFDVAITIERMPTIDAMPVVRCKECKYYELDSMESVGGMPLIVAHEICCFWGNGCKTNPNGFCSFGERKDND